MGTDGKLHAGIAFGKDIRLWLKSLFIPVAVGIIFYNSFLAVILLLPLCWVYVRIQKRELAKQEDERLAGAFKDGIIAVSFSLNVGYSIENAFREAYKEMQMLYGSESRIAKEFRIICNRMAQNENIEDILEDFAAESGVEDILYFAQVFRYAKRSGGDLMSIIRNTASVIRDKNEVAEDIRTIISGRRMEQMVMNFVPFGIILYLRLASPEFIEPLYGNAAGVAVMTGCLAVYALAIALGRKITDIKV